MIRKMIDKFLKRVFAEQFEQVENACREASYAIDHRTATESLKDVIERRMDEDKWLASKLSEAEVQLIVLNKIDARATGLANKIAEEVRNLTIEKISNDISDEFVKANLTKILKDIDVKAVANAVTLKTAGTMLGSQVALQQSASRGSALFLGGS